MKRDSTFKPIPLILVPPKQTFLCKTILMHGDEGESV